MATVHLLGHVVPGEPQISLDNVPEFDWKWEEHDFSFHFKISVKFSVVDVECTLPDYKPEYLTEIHRRSFDMARSMVNLAAFSQGYGWFLVFDHFMDDRGSTTPFIAHDPEIAKLCTTCAGSGYGEMLPIVATDHALTRHLNDLIQAISVPHETTSCARVVDGLKSMIAPTASDSAAWAQMQKTLRVDKNYLKLITDASREARHGKHMRIEGDVTMEITRRAWKIMDRYLEFRKRGGKAPLPESEFPILTG